MKLWISKNSEVPVAEQLTTQIMLAIHSGELKPNQKLPSTRELARRFALHSNTVNAAYRDLARRVGFTLEREVGCMFVCWPQTVHSTGTCSSIN
jgi:GntR family transcriptional regulator